MSHSVGLEEIRKHLPHIDADNLQGRLVPLHSVYTEGEWRLWVPDQKGSVIRLKGEPVEACYFSDSLSRDDDIRLRPIEFLQQRAGWPDTACFANALLADFRNLAASLAKLRLLHSQRASVTGVSRMAATEVEYIFIVCRSAFDLFQKAISRVWWRVRLFDESLKQRRLPDSFRKMVMSADVCMSIDQIIAKHGVPEPIAKAYHNSAKFFEWLRDFRDAMTHHGSEVDCVFVGDEGFSIRTKEKPFCSMDIWCPENLLPNDLGSLQSAMRFAVLETLRGLDYITYVLEKVIEFPPPIVPKLTLLVRGPNLAELQNLESRIKDAAWFDGQPGQKAQP